MKASGHACQHAAAIALVACMMLNNSMGATADQYISRHGPGLLVCCACKYVQYINLVCVHDYVHKYVYTYIHILRPDLSNFRKKQEVQVLQPLMLNRGGLQRKVSSVNTFHAHTFPAAHAFASEGCAQYIARHWMHLG